MVKPQRKADAIMRLIAAVALSGMWLSQLHAQSATLTPKGDLRVGLQTYNSALISQSQQGEFNGVAADLANKLASKLGVSARLVPYDTAVHFNQSIGKDQWDVAFIPRDLSRTGQLAFSEPILQLDSSYVVRPGASIRTPEDVDRPGVRVAVAQGSPADAYLSRSIRSATIVRIFGGLTTAEEALRSGRVDVYADYTHVAYRVAAIVVGANVVVSGFNTVRITLAIPKSNAAALSVANDFVQEAKRDGTVADAIKKAGFSGVRLGR
jgi:polar amino acid transport system substrate-binding protein